MGLVSLVRHPVAIPRIPLTVWNLRAGSSDLVGQSAPRVARV